MKTDRNLLQITPEEFTKLFNHACNLQENGDMIEALEVYYKLLNYYPGSHLLHFNCGLAYFDLKNFLKAESHYDKALANSADDPDIHYNRGLNFRRLYRFEDAVKSFEAALKTGDTSVDTLYNLALCHQDLDDNIKTAHLYNIILSRDPNHQSSINNYAYLCHKSGDTKQAASLYTRLLKLNPEHQAAKHMLCSITGTPQDTAPLVYVESIFDNYADNFEQSLVEKLEYRTPEVLHDFFCKVIHKTSLRKCLDLGCGTGLAGERFRQCCKELTGIDISRKMLEVAIKKKLYDRLIKDDISHFFQSNDQKYNLILAADVFTYVGKLERIFTECNNSIEPSGFLIFSVEETLKCQKGFELKPTGRFGHSVDYIKKLSKKTGWTVTKYKHSKLRKENGEWIMGYLYILQQ
jgi:predicted TPR repeat methyltransferase